MSGSNPVYLVRRHVLGFRMTPSSPHPVIYSYENTTVGFVESANDIREVIILESELDCSVLQSIEQLMQLNGPHLLRSHLAFN